MKILLVEDDPFKEGLVLGVLQDAVEKILVTVARSVQQAVDALQSGPYDLIVLDMSLPSHEIKPGGAQPISQPSGGIEVLLELSYEGRLDAVIIMTQYPEIEFNDIFYPISKFPRALSKELEVNLLGAIHFDKPDGTWQANICGFLKGRAR